MEIPPNPVISEFRKDLYHVPYDFRSDYQSIDQKTDLLLIFEKWLIDEKQKEYVNDKVRFRTLCIKKMSFHGFQDEIGRIDIDHQKGNIPVDLIIDAEKVEYRTSQEVMDERLRYVFQTPYTFYNCINHTQNKT